MNNFQIMAYMAIGAAVLFIIFVIIDQLKKAWGKMWSKMISDSVKQWTENIFTKKINDHTSLFHDLNREKKLLEEMKEIADETIQQYHDLWGIDKAKDYLKRDRELKGSGDEMIKCPHCKGLVQVNTK